MRYLILCLLVIWALPVFADLKAAKKAFSAENYSLAYHLFKDYAELGNHQAQYALGYMHEQGLARPVDLQLAYAWFALAAQGENQDIQIYFRNFKSRLNPQQRVDFANHAIWQHYNDEVLLTSIMSAFPKEQPAIVEPLERAAPKYPMSLLKNALTGISIVEFSLDGNGYPKDIQFYEGLTHKRFDRESYKAILQWKYLAVQFDDIDTPHGLQKVKFEYNIEGMKLDAEAIDKRVEKIIEKAEQGGVQEQFLYALFLDQIPMGTLTKYDSQKASQWYLKAAKNGSAHAMYELGKKLLNKNESTGGGHTQALRWLWLAAKQNHVPSELFLGQELTKGTDKPDEIKKGITVLKSAAGHGNLLASKFLAETYLYRRQLGIYDPKSALRYALKAMDYDYLDPSFHEVLALAYAHNNQYKKAQRQLTKAIRWSKKLGRNVVGLEQQLAFYKKKKRLPLE